TFFLCDPATVAANGGDCSAGGTVVGMPKTLVGGSATSDPTTLTSTPGKYCWHADYSGDATYSPATHTDTTSECFTVVLPPQPATTTTLSTPTGGSVAPGTSASDAATITGSSGTPTGTVTFFLCDPTTVGAN